MYLYPVYATRSRTGKLGGPPGADAALAAEEDTREAAEMYSAKTSRSCRPRQVDVTSASASGVNLSQTTQSKVRKERHTARTANRKKIHGWLGMVLPYFDRNSYERHLSAL
jgi:hypothetical protein